MSNFNKHIKNCLANALIVIVSSVFALVLCEAALRGVRAYKDVRKGRKMCRLSSNPAIGYEHIPGYVWEGFRVNSYGFRGAEFDPLKKSHSPERVFRIVVLGDSITAAPYLPEEYLYTRVLERKLNEGAPKNIRFEALNAAVGGYNTWQELEVYKEKVRPLKPDIVILGICQNDFMGHGELYKDIFGIVRGDLDVDDSDVKLLSDIMIYKKLNQALISMKLAFASEDEVRKYLAASAPTLAQRWSDGGKPLTELSPALKNDGAKSLFVIFPYKFQLEGSDYRSSDERFMEFCKEAVQPCLDLFDVYKSSNGDLFIGNDHIHPTIRGHAIAAEAIYRHLKENGLIG